MTDLMDLHTHTVASGHAYNTIWEMAAAAAEKGLPLLGIADHGPAMPGSADELYFRNFKMLPREVHGVKLMFGCELNIQFSKFGSSPFQHLGNLQLGSVISYSICCTANTVRAS